MNSIWNKNIALFTKRFPELAKQFSADFSILQDLPEDLKAPLEILPSRLKNPAATDFFPTAKENGKYLHSAYNPLREADQTAKTIRNSKKDVFGAVFFSFGLGYAALKYAELFPNDTIILVESDPKYFFTALSLLDWSIFFNTKNIILALKTEPSQVISLIEKCGGFNHLEIYENAAQTEHAKNYFSTLNALIARSKQKTKINSSTLEKFSSLWLRNSCKNLHFLAEKDGVDIYKNQLNSNIPALLLAAGPTLSEILPHLKELKKRSVLIAVDTALRACLKAQVEPDFIILADPQYYAYRHIAGLSSPKSVLITESAAYPAVFRFCCRKIVMCSSMFPLGQFVESKIGKKGKLSAGGSVSTTAWDFARLIGAKNIIFAGLDLGYPDFETHIRGSTFEEKIHAFSNRLNPAEKNGISALFASGTEKAKDYSGNEILTDAKMKMFAWWFESKQEEFFSDGIQSYSLSSKSLRIPGFKVLNLEDFLNFPEISNLKNDFFSKCEEKSNYFSDNNFSAEFLEKSQNQNFSEIAQNNEKIFSEKQEKSKEFEKVLKMIQDGLEELYSLAKSAESISDAAVLPQNLQKRQEFSAQLSFIDAKITNSKFKDIASLIFPTESRLNKIFAQKNFSSDKLTASFQQSKIIYGLVKQSVREYQKNLFQD